MTKLNEAEEDARRQDAFNRVQIPYSCETCRWYRYSKVDNEWVCINRHSDFCAEQMSNYDTCDNWKEKQRVG